MNVKEAVELVLNYVRSFPELFPSDLPRLEETEIEDNGNWSVTLSFSAPGMPYETGRFYKRFEIDAKTKEVISMKIRNPLVA
jgi:hypothetical protein